MLCCSVRDGRLVRRVERDRDRSWIIIIGYLTQIIIGASKGMPVVVVVGKEAGVRAGKRRRPRSESTRRQQCQFASMMQSRRSSFNRNFNAAAGARALLSRARPRRSEVVLAEEAAGQE